MSKSVTDEEVAQMQIYIAENEKIKNSLEKAKLVNEMYEYLSKTQEILKMSGFRKTVIDKLTEFSSQPENIISILRPGAAALCERLQDEFREYVEGCEAFGVPTKVPIQYKILGTGSYGTVVKPGLPNINESNAVIAAFPGMVSKIMKNKKQL